MSIIASNIRSIFTIAFWLSAIKCIIITCISAIAFIWAVGSIASSFQLFETAAFNDIFSWVANAGAAVAAWFLFPSLMPLIASFVQTKLLNKLEKQQYGLESPSLDHSRLGADLLFAIKSIGFNLILLLVTWTVFPLYIVLYLVINGWLFGTEFFHIVSDRRVFRDEATTLIEKNKFTVYGFGVLIAIAATTPVINLIMPLIAAILMMNIFHHLKANK